MVTLFTRRSLLIGGSALAASNLMKPIYGAVSCKLDKKISLYNIHTGEFLKETYMHKDDFVPEVMKKIQHFMRDHRNGKTHIIEPELIQLINRLQLNCSVPGLTTFDVISGYRSPETNEMLRRRSSGVAKNSFHTKGCAIDIRLPKHLRELKNLATSYKKGGVGYYPKSGFVHVDIRSQPAYWGAA